MKMLQTVNKKAPQATNPSIDVLGSSLSVNKFAKLNEEKKNEREHGESAPHTFGSIATEGQCPAADARSLRCKKGQPGPQHGGNEL